MKKKFFALLLAALMVVSLIPMAVFATGTSYAITNGTPESAKETNHGYIAIDKATAAEGETVTVTVNPAEGYQLKSLTATPVAPTISTIADVLATVEDFPEGKQEKGSSPEPIGEAWSCGSCCAFEMNNLALLLKASNSYMLAQLTTSVTKEENCYTATVSTLGTLKFNMTDGVLTGFTYTHNEGKSEAYDGTYAPASTPSAKLKPITPAKQTDGTYQFTMPAYAVTVTAEFEAKAITIADVIATYENFPLTKDTDLYWTNEQGTTCYYFNNNLFFRYTSVKSLMQSMTVNVTANGKNYTYSDGTVTYTFIMDEDSGVLSAITVSGSTDTKYNGTYNAPPTKYTVTNGTTDTHGSIELGKTSAAKDETVTVTVTPDKDYQLKSLVVLSAVSLAPPITPARDASDKTKYTFKMPSYPVRVTAEFEEKAITIADILPDDFPTCVDVLPPNLWVNNNGVYMMVLPYSIEIFTLDEYGNPDYVELVNDIRTATLTKNGNNYTYTNNGVTTTFLMSDNGLESVKIEGLTGEYVDFNGTYGEQHTHSFTYTVNGGKLTATCTAGCDKGYDTTPLTLTLTAPASLVYDGNAKAFTFADGEADAWTGAGLELPTFEYYLDKPETPWLDGLDGDPIAAAEGYVVMIRFGVKAAQVEFNIDKATPYIKTTPAPNDIEYGKKLSDSTLFGGYVQISTTDSSEVGGLFEWTNPDTVPGIDDSETTEYDVTFTPADTNNYNTVSCKVKIKVTHTHNPVKVNGQAATETASGWKDYYKCDCGALFADENGTTPIENLEAWKAQDGNIPKLTHNPTLSEGKPATFNEPGYKPYYLCNNCGKYYYSEDATGLIEIPDINAWKAEGGAGYIPSGKEKLTVTDFDEEPVLPGAETYEVKEDGIHIYSGDIIFSGEIDEKVFIEGPDQAATFTDLVIKNSVYANNLSENVTIYMDGATIEGNVSATGNGTDDLYLCINIENDNEIKGDVTSDGSITVYGFPNATLDVKGAKATTMLYLNGLRLENMKEEYNVESTLTATPDDASKPITFAVKKEAVFPDDEEFIINGGKPFAYGEDYNIAPPVVCDENGTPFDPQPELTVVYYEYITDGEWDWEIKALDGKPTKEGTYLITFYMPESDLYYTGSHFYEYKIGHNIQMVEGKAATTEEAGYKAYYECKGCGKFYEDASGLVEITDLAKWKAQGGNGYIAKLEEEPTSPQTGDTSNMTLWVMLLALSSMGLCACLVLGKKRKNVQ